MMPGKAPLLGRAFPVSGFAGCIFSTHHIPIGCSANCPGSFDQCKTGYHTLSSTNGLKDSCGKTFRWNVAS